VERSGLRVQSVLLGNPRVRRIVLCDRRRNGNDGHIELSTEIREHHPREHAPAVVQRPRAKR
jgi:hypothetical protein